MVSISRCHYFDTARCCWKSSSQHQLNILYGRQAGRTSTFRTECINKSCWQRKWHASEGGDTSFQPRRHRELELPHFCERHCSLDWHSPGQKFLCCMRPRAYTLSIYEYATAAFILRKHTAALYRCNKAAFVRELGTLGAKVVKSSNASGVTYFVNSRTEAFRPDVCDGPCARSPWKCL